MEAESEDGTGGWGWRWEQEQKAHSIAARQLGARLMSERYQKAYGSAQEPTEEQKAELKQAARNNVLQMKERVEHHQVVVL